MGAMRCAPHAPMCRVHMSFAVDGGTAANVLFGDNAARAARVGDFEARAAKGGQGDTVGRVPPPRHGPSSPGIRMKSDPRGRDAARARPAAAQAARMFCAHPFTRRAALGPLSTGNSPL